jgi:hypothetical protein
MRGDRKRKAFRDVVNRIDEPFTISQLKEKLGLEKSSIYWSTGRIVNMLRATPNIKVVGSIKIRNRSFVNLYAWRG